MTVKSNKRREDMSKGITPNGKADRLLKNIESSKNPEIIKDLCDLLEDMLELRKFQEKIRNLESEMFSGLRAAFFVDVDGLSDVDVLYTLERANAKRKRMSELERRSKSKGADLSEEQSKKLKEMGLIPCEICIEKDECDCVKEDENTEDVNEDGKVIVDDSDNEEK